MNCRRVQKLIPLHVESDLPSGLATRVASHLEDCGRCNWLADEYKESQGWLRSYTPHEFDEETLDDVRRGVMRRIADSNVRPSLWASLGDHWSRRPLLAVSAGLLIVVGMVVFYIYQTRAKVNLDVIAREEKQTPNETPRQSPAPGIAVTPGAALPGAVGGRRPSHNVKRHERTQGVPSQTLARTLPSERIIESATAPTEHQRTSSDNPNGSRDVLRIEIQTGDPNIRIIWFAPKETDSHQNKPATD